MRVVVPGGIVRVVVPDLEDVARAYLARLEEAAAHPGRAEMLRYDWSVFELFDQMVREETGGSMLKALAAGDYDPEYIDARNGDEYAHYTRPPEPEPKPDVPAPPPQTAPPSPAGEPSIAAKISDLAQRTLRVGRHRRPKSPPPEPLPPDPRESGELHRWMYDRLSLRRLLESAGLADVEVVTHDASRIPGWGSYRLDTSDFGDRPRKPESLFMEGRVSR